MAWSPIGVTVSLTSSTGTVGTQFLGVGSPNVVTNAAFSNLISRVFNGAATFLTFSLGAASHTPRKIPVAPNSFMYISHGPADNFFISDGAAATTQITPGQGQITT